MASNYPIVDGVHVVRTAPAGYVVDLAHPQQHYATAHYVAFAVGITLSTMAIVQRYYTKIFLSDGFQVDDVFMLLVYISAIVTQALNLSSFSRQAFGTHLWEMTLDRYSYFTLVNYMASPIYALTTLFTKLSLLTFYLHLSPHRWYRKCVFATIGLVLAYSVPIFFLLIFACSPVSSSWDVYYTGTAKCVDRPILYIATAVANIVSDVILLGLPIPLLYGLKMRLAQKIGAMVVFAVGSVTVATSIVRLNLLLPTLTSQDMSWELAPASFWVFIEANLFVICGSFPTLRKFALHFAPRLLDSGYIFGSRGDRSKGQSNGTTPKKNSRVHSQASAANRIERQSKRYVQFSTGYESGTGFELGTIQEPENEAIRTIQVRIEADGSEERLAAGQVPLAEGGILKTRDYTVTRSHRNPRPDS